MNDMSWEEKLEFVKQSLQTVREEGRTQFPATVESAIDYVESMLEELADYDDHQPDEIQEWHDFDPDC